MLRIYGHRRGELGGHWRFAPAISERDFARPVFVRKHRVRFTRREDLGFDVMHIDAEYAFRLGLVPGRPQRKRRRLKQAFFGWVR